MIDFAASSDGVYWKDDASHGVLRPVALVEESTRGVTVGEHIARSVRRDANNSAHTI